MYHLAKYLPIYGQVCLFKYFIFIAKQVDKLIFNLSYWMSIVPTFVPKYDRRQILHTEDLSKSMVKYWTKYYWVKYYWVKYWAKYWA